MKKSGAGNSMAKSSPFPKKGEESMKKKMFNATIGGYYLVSIILGIVMMFTVSLMLCDLWDYLYDSYYESRELAMEQYGATWTESGYVITDSDAEAQAVQKDLNDRDTALESAWSFLPMTKLWNMMYVPGKNGLSGRNYGPVWMTVFAVITVIFAVMIMEGKSMNKAWRLKMIQAVSIAATLLLFSSALKCAQMRSYGRSSTVDMVVPVILLIIPLIVLRKTQLSKTSNDPKITKVPESEITSE